MSDDPIVQLTEWPIPPKHKPTHRFDKYMDGGIYQATPQQLDLGTVMSARTTLRRVAEKLGKRIRVAEFPDHVVWQAYDKSE